MKKITPYGLQLVAESGLVDMTLHLFSGDFTPTNDGDFAVTAGQLVELTADGYAAENLTGASWSFAEGDLRDGYPVIEATQDQIDFVLTGAGTAYGWYTIYNDGTSDHVVWAERFSSVAEIGAGGGTISINPLHVFGVEEEA